MNDIIENSVQLPDSLEDLTQFVLIGKAKLNAYMLKLQTVNRLTTAQEIRDQTLKEAQESKLGTPYSETYQRDYSEVLHFIATWEPPTGTEGYTAYLLNRKNHKR